MQNNINYMNLEEKLNLRYTNVLKQTLQISLKINYGIYSKGRNRTFQSETPGSIPYTIQSYLKS